MGIGQLDDLPNVFKIVFSNLRANMAILRSLLYDIATIDPKVSVYHYLVDLQAI